MRKKLLAAAAIVVSLGGGGAAVALTTTTASAATAHKALPAVNRIEQIVAPHHKVRCGREAKILARIAKAEAAAASRLAAHDGRLTKAQAQAQAPVSAAKPAGKHHGRAATGRAHRLSKGISRLEKVKSEGTARQQAILAACKAGATKS